MRTKVPLVGAFVANRQKCLLFSRDAQRSASVPRSAARRGETANVILSGILLRSTWYGGAERIDTSQETHSTGRGVRQAARGQTAGGQAGLRVHQAGRTDGQTGRAGR